MKTIKQMLRQPLKTLSGVLLMALAAAILCLCVGQALAVRTTEKKLEQQFSTIAIPQGRDQTGGLTTSSRLVPAMEEEMLAWLEQAAAEHPDVIKSIARHGILSAYIPELTPLNITAEEDYQPTVTKENFEYYFYQPTTDGADTLSNIPYTCAMLVITLDEVSEPEEVVGSTTLEGLTPDDFLSLNAYYSWYHSAEKVPCTMGYTIELTGTVTEVLSLQEGYRNPVGRIARLTMTVPTLEELEELDLVVGEPHIVYGMDYVDEYWKMAGEISLSGKYDWADFETFDPSQLEILEGWELEKYQNYYEIFHDPIFRDAYARFYGILIDEDQYKQINAISMTLDVPINKTTYEAVRDEDGILLELIPDTQVEYTDWNGETVTVGFEEYTARYTIPTIARLDGDPEDFLQSEEGALWQATLEQCAVNNQSFAVMGVDKLSYLADFALEKTKIVTGRDFTAEELADGSRVCILHEELAVANGIEIGDTITLSLYGDDPALPYQWHRSDNKGLVNPSASFYFDTTPFTETAEYTVVGICRGEWTFPDVAEDPYAFSANTVYVPKSSVQSQMETSVGIPFVTPVLQNGKMEQFHTLARQAGYADRFKYNDQGYSVIAGNFHNYEALARQVLIVGAALYAVLLLLFLLLYPGSQRKSVRVMQSLGAAPGRQFGHVLASSMSIILPSSVLGGLAGILLWDKVVAALQASAEATVALELEPATLGLIAAAQLALALILSVLTAIFVSARRGMAGRR